MCKVRNLKLYLGKNITFRKSFLIKKKTRTKNTLIILRTMFAYKIGDWSSS